MSGFLKIRDFFKKSVLRKTAEFSVSDTGDRLILTCLQQTCFSAMMTDLNREFAMTISLALGVARTAIL